MGKQAIQVFHHNTINPRHPTISTTSNLEYAICSPTVTRQVNKLPIQQDLLEDVQLEASIIVPHYIEDNLMSTRALEIQDPKDKLQRGIIAKILLLTHLRL